jgi:hypothetical protein
MHRVLFICGIAVLLIVPWLMHTVTAQPAPTASTIVGKVG